MVKPAAAPGVDVHEGTRIAIAYTVRAIAMLIDTKIHEHGNEPDAVAALKELRAAVEDWGAQQKRAVEVNHGQ